MVGVRGKTYCINLVDYRSCVADDPGPDPSVYKGRAGYERCIQVSNSMALHQLCGLESSRCHKPERCVTSLLRGSRLT
jgi:hypothetical protein